MSTMVSPFSADKRKRKHVGVDLYDMYLVDFRGASRWVKALTHNVMEHNASMLSGAGWVVVDFREQYMCGSEDNVSDKKGLAQVCLREDKEVQ